MQHLSEPDAFGQYLAPLREKEWVVYAKPPFATPAQVLEYVGRYTHRVAITNHRLLNIEEGQVSFRWKDYRDGNAHKTMTLEAGEFIRRFLLHALPPGLQRIRYYGLLGNRHRRQKLEQCRALLRRPAAPHKAQAAPLGAEQRRRADYQDRYKALTGISLRQCPICHRGRMFIIEQIARSRSAPPPDTS